MRCGVRVYGDRENVSSHSVRTQDGCHGFIHHAGSKLENYANTVRARKQAPRPGASLGEAYSVDKVHTVKATAVAVGRHARR